jgi:hypothetical protein
LLITVCGVGAARVQGILVGWIASSVWSIAYIKAIRTPFAYETITGRPIPRRERDADAFFDVNITAPAKEEPAAVDAPEPSGAASVSASTSAESQSDTASVASSAAAPGSAQK